MKFFLSGVIDTAEDSAKTFKKIINLKNEYEQDIIKIGRQAKLGYDLLLFMFSKPIIKVKDVEERLNIVYNTAGSLVGKLCKIGILKEITGYSRNRLFMLWKYLDLFKR